MSVFKRNKKWVAQWPDGGRVRTQTVGTKVAADRLFNHQKEQAILRKHGLIDPDTERFAAMEAVPVTTHIMEYRTFHESKGGTGKQSAQVYGRLMKVADAGGIKKLSELTETNVRRAIRQIEHAGYRIGKQRRIHSAETLNQHLKAVRQFVKWLVNDARLRRSQLGNLSLMNTAVDRRHDRRALTDAEIAKLLKPDALHKNRTHRSALSPQDRVMLYRVALGTGLRASELASLQTRSFDLAAGTVTVQAAFSKHRRQDVQPMASDVVETLRPWLDGKRGKLFPLPHNMAKVFRRDLAAVGIAYVVDGKYADFHSLRHTYISRLVRAKLPPKVTQSLARHSTITLTMDRYAHLHRDDLARHLETVPPLPGAVAGLQSSGELGGCKPYTVRTCGDAILQFMASDVTLRHYETRDLGKILVTRPTGLEPVTVRLEGRRGLVRKLKSGKSYELPYLRRCGGAVRRHWAHCGAGKAIIHLKMQVRKAVRR